MKNKKIYLASPFFNEKELRVVEAAETILEKRGYEVYSPRKHEYRGAEAGTYAWADGIFMEDVKAIKENDLVVMLYHGNYSDSGTAWECGFAWGIGKPVIAVQLGDVSNLMIHQSVRANITLDELQTYDFEHLPQKIYEGEML